MGCGASSKTGPMIVEESPRFDGISSNVVRTSPSTLRQSSVTFADREATQKLPAGQQPSVSSLQRVSSRSPPASKVSHHPSSLVTAPSAASLPSMSAPSLAHFRRSTSSSSSVLARTPVLASIMTSEQRQVLQGAELTTPEQRAFRSLIVSGDGGQLPVPCSDGTFKKMRLRMWLDGEVSLGIPVADNAESDEDGASLNLSDVTVEEVSTNHKLCSKLEYRGLIEARAALFGGDTADNTRGPSQNPGVSTSSSATYMLSSTQSSRRLNSSLNPSLRSFRSITSPNTPPFFLPSSHPSRRQACRHRRRLRDAN